MTPVRSVRVERPMGTVVTLDVRDAGGSTSGAAAIEATALGAAGDAFFEELHRIDQRFSPWLPDSEVSRISDGRLAEADASPDVRFVLAACDHLHEISGGAFDARGHRADGRIDPSGFVKGWAIEEAARHLHEAGARHFAVNAGGDILTRGDAVPGSGAGWRVGIRDPERVDRVVRVVRVRGLAVATSGLYERGAHIRDPRGAPGGERQSDPFPGSEPTPASRRHPALASLTVTGPSLAWADAYATAGFVLGPAALAWLDDRPGYGGMAIHTDRRLTWTSRLDPLLLAIEPGSAVEPLFSRSSQESAVSFGA
jgi:thiamine biosynthesis lipoprotein